jgi:hypothetical protein
MIEWIMDKMDTPITWGASFKLTGIILVIEAVCWAVWLIADHFRDRIDDIFNEWKSKTDEEA